MEKTEAQEFVCAADVANKQKTPTIPLIMLHKGDRGILAQQVDGGYGACRRLSELGLIPGTIIELVNKINDGPVIIKVKGSKLALGRGLAKKIRVILE